MTRRVTYQQQTFGHTLCVSNSRVGCGLRTVPKLTILRKKNENVRNLNFQLLQKSSFAELFKRKGFTDGICDLGDGVKYNCASYILILKNEAFINFRQKLGGLP